MRRWRHIHNDIEIPRPKNCDIEIQGLKHQGIEKRRQLSHDIVIPRHFFRGQKGTTSGFQNPKTTTSRFQKASTLSFCGILTLSDTKPLTDPLALDFHSV